MPVSVITPSDTPPTPPLQTIKILRVTARLSIGGPTIHVVLLTAGLDARRFESSLVSGAEHPGEGSMLDYALSHGVRPIVIPEIVATFSLTLRDLQALLRLYRLIRQLQPHIVETHTTKAGFIGRLAAYLGSVPVVVHTFHGHVLHGYFGRFRSWLLRRMERSLAHLTDCIVAVDDQVKRDLERYQIAAAEKIVVVPYGLDLEPFLTCDVSRGELRRELDLPDDARLVGIVGRLVPIKNHHLFLDAAALVTQQDPRAHFLIVGDGALRREVEQYAEALGIARRTIFTGWRRDLPCIYVDLDVLAVTSKNEGTPLAAIEAMAAGCPVIATRVGGLPDLISNGETGYLVPSGNVPALAAALLRVLQDLATARRLGDAARMHVRERFAVGRLITDMERMYLELFERMYALR